MSTTENPQNTEPKTLSLSFSNLNDVQNLLDSTKVGETENFLRLSEYRDKYNGDRLYNKGGPSKVYVSKRVNEESDFWSGGKYCYDNKILKKEIVYKTNNMESYTGASIPPEFVNKEHNRTVTRISEYSNALYSGGVFKNPQFLSC